jgi:hypothetical protein
MQHDDQQSKHVAAQLPEPEMQHDGQQSKHVAAQ